MNNKKIYFVLILVFVILSGLFVIGIFSYKEKAIVTKTDYSKEVIEVQADNGDEEIDQKIKERIKKINAESVKRPLTSEEIAFILNPMRQMAVESGSSSPTLPIEHKDMEQEDIDSILKKNK